MYFYYCTFLFTFVFVYMAMVLWQMSSLCSFQFPSGSS